MASILFPSNITVNGTNSDDFMLGTQTGGNVNDIVYGHQGNDTIVGGEAGVSNSTMYGGQGDDAIYAFNGGGNVIYGNKGNDTITSSFDTGDSVFGGQGDDSIEVGHDTSSAIYGNAGNDTITAFDNQNNNYFGGQGNDKIFDFDSSGDAIYGNQGNDVLVGAAGEGESIANTHEYGGQGDDTLVFTGTGGGRTTNDAETGGQGNDLFIAANDSGGESLLANDIVTVTDFLAGNDHLAMTDNASVIPLAKIDVPGAVAATALTAADAAYTSHPNREYVFVYGGTGAGFLFYNGDSNSSTVATAGFAITGATGEGSVNSSDIITSKLAAFMP